MDELRDLYQEMIVDHGRRPRNFHKLEGANYSAKGFNPLCGDKLTLYIKLGGGGTIEDVSFDGAGCAISMASASLMTEALKGKTVAEAETLFESFHGLMVDQPAAHPVDLGKLKVLAGVKDFPSRVKCATLSWHTLQAALHGDEEVTTE